MLVEAEVVQIPAVLVLEERAVVEQVLSLILMQQQEQLTLVAEVVVPGIGRIRPMFCLAQAAPASSS